MLIYQQDCDILSFAGEFDESLLDNGSLSLVVDNEEVLLSVGTGCDVLLAKLAP